VIEVIIPSYKDIKLKHLVLDYNGTLAVGGIFKREIKEKINRLSQTLNIHVITADTFGNVLEQIRGIDVKLHIISEENGSSDKLKFIENLGSEYCVAVGNGVNDSLMVKSAEVGICILGDEGCSVKTLLNSDIVIKNIEDCIDMLLDTNRLKATLRG